MKDYLLDVTRPVPQKGEFSILTGESLTVLQGIRDNVFHAVVTDPPYEINYSAKDWDRQGTVLSPDYWKEVLRVTRPGGHAIVFGYPRKMHLVATAMDLAGWEIRDDLVWLFDRANPKSVNLAAEMIAQGVDPEIANQWLGWGTGIVNCHENLVLARKPLDGTLVQNLVQWGTGGLCIRDTAFGKLAKDYEGLGRSKDYPMKRVDQRWTQNVLSAESEDGPASAWWCCKPDLAERDYGLQHLPVVDMIPERKQGSAGRSNPRAGAGRGKTPRHNWHPTVKPVDLMRYLVALVLPPAGFLLDPFCGSGTTEIGAYLHDRDHRFVGIDRDSADLAAERIKAWRKSC